MKTEEQNKDDFYAHLSTFKITSQPPSFDLKAYYQKRKQVADSIVQINNEKNQTAKQSLILGSQNLLNELKGISK